MTVQQRDPGDENDCQEMPPAEYHRRLEHMSFYLGKWRRLEQEPQLAYYPAFQWLLTADLEEKQVLMRYGT